MPRYLFVAEVPDDRMGGMSRHFRFVGEAITRCGYEVEYLFLDQMPGPLAAPLRGFTLDQGRRALWAVVRRFRRSGPPSLLYWSVNSAFPFTPLRRLWALARRVPVVGMTFGVEERWWPELQHDARHHGAPRISARQRVTTGLIRMRALRAATRACDHVVCVSSQDRRHLLDRYGMPPDRVHFLPVGVAPEFFTPGEDGRTGRKVLFVGTWIWRKGVKFLTQAMDRVWRAIPDCSLSLVGTFRDAAEVRRDWPEGLRDRIRVVPRADRAALLHEYATHDVFVLPSLFEGMPLTLAEAMAAGLAVVTTSTCGMLDLVRPEHDGVLVPPRDAEALADALIRLIRDPARQRRLGEQARTRVRSLTWDRVAEQLLDVFHRSVAGRSA